jgi:hypothetical protein
LTGTVAADRLPPVIGHVAGVRYHNRALSLVVDQPELLLDCLEVEPRPLGEDPVLVEIPLAVEEAEILRELIRVNELVDVAHHFAHRPRCLQTDPQHSRRRLGLRLEHVEVSFGRFPRRVAQAAVAIAPPGRLGQAVEARQGPVDDREVEVDASLDQLRRYDPTGLASL